MRVAIGFVVVAGLYGQAFQPGFVRGVMVANEAGLSSGEFSIRPPADRVFRFRFDSKTWIERSNERIPGSALRPGELLEVVSDRDPIPLQYARLVHVIEPTRARSPIETGKYRLSRSPDADGGNLTFSGIVSSRNGASMTLRTRFDGERMIYLRPDTQCLEQGYEVDPADIQPNARVFVRAGRTTNHGIVAYQVIWGTILQPASPRE